VGIADELFHSITTAQPYFMGLSFLAP